MEVSDQLHVPFALLSEEESTVNVGQAWLGLREQTNLLLLQRNETSSSVVQSVV
jgi:hypothetical protein